MIIRHLAEIVLMGLSVVLDLFALTTVSELSSRVSVPNVNFVQKPFVGLHSQTVLGSVLLLVTDARILRITI